jgi:hypothetical protein
MAKSSNHIEVCLEIGRRRTCAGVMEWPGWCRMGRSYRDAPEIEGMAILEGSAPVGQFVPVKIDGALTYDLSGHVELQQG